MISDHDAIGTATAILEAVDAGIVYPTRRRSPAGEGSRGVEGREIIERPLQLSTNSSTTRFSGRPTFSPMRRNASPCILTIGSNMLEQMDGRECEARVIEIVHQLNIGRVAITDDAELTRLAELNLEAGHKAKLAAAYRPALEYLTCGRDALPASCWSSTYNLSFELVREYAECAYICGDFESAENYSQRLLERSKTDLERASVCHMQAVQYATSQKLDLAFDVAWKGLSLLGVEIEREPTEETIGAEYAATAENLDGREIVDLINEPEITDPRLQIIMKLLCEIFFVAYVMGRKPFLVATALRAVNLSLEQGNVPESAYIYNVFGFLVGHVFDDLGNAKKFGELALLLDERFDDPQRRAANLFTNIIFMQAWNLHPREVVRSYERAIEIGLETGNLIYMSYACANVTVWDPDLDLHSAIEKGKQCLKTAATANYQDGTDISQISQHVRLNLTGQTSGRLSLSSDSFDEQAAVARFDETGYHLGVCLYHIYKMQTCYTYAEYEEALIHADAAEPLLDTLAGQLQVVDFCLFAFLTRIAVYTEASDEHKEDLISKLDASLEQMRHWARHSRVNFGHYALAMSAEMARLGNQRSEAHDLYDRAIKEAHQNGYRRYVGLFNELAGEFWLGNGKQYLATRHLRAALDCYQAWGASAKVEQMHEHHGEPLLAVSVSPTTPSGPLDLASLLKASQAISEKIVLEDLLAKLMDIVIKNAGAQSGCLLLVKTTGAWAIEAWNRGDGSPVVETRELSKSEKHLATSVVNYVIHTQDTLVVDDASKDNRFSDDNYVRAVRPKSLLCMPLINRGQLRGILYLENSLLTGAFSSHHLELLNVLLGQAAISIENARLFADLQDSERKFRSIFDESHDMIILTAMDGRILEVNAACESLLGFRREEVLERNVLEFYPTPAHRERLLTELESQGAVRDYGVKLRHRSGQDRDVSFTATLRLSENGEPIGIQGIVRDATAQKLTELERLRTLALKKDKEAAEAAYRVKSDFLATMSHELRTPLNSILGSSQTLEHNASDLPKEAQTGIATIQRSGAHLLNLINNILDLSKIEADKMELDLIDFSLFDLIHDVVEMLRPAVRHQESVTLEVDYGRNIPLGLHGDAKRLSQVLLNLLGNAVKFTNSGSVKLRVKRIDTGTDAATLRFDVEDTGIGIHQDQLREIFAPFHQSGERHRMTDGTGLGLAISQSFLSLMDSEIVVESTVDVGSMFSFVIELARANTEVESRHEIRDLLVGSVNALAQGAALLSSTPPLEALRTTIGLAEAGDLSGLRTYLASLNASDPAHAEFVARAEQLVDRFELDLVSDFARQLVDGSPEGKSGEDR